MNRKFKELAEQCWDQRLDGRLYFDQEQFAELIVRECAQVCRDQPNVYALKADRDNCAIAIEQHFEID